MTLSNHQEQRIRRLAFRLSEYNPSDDDAFYDAAIAHITEFVRELNDTWEAYIKASQDYGDAVRACQCGSRDLSASRNGPIKRGKCGREREL